MIERKIHRKLIFALLAICMIVAIIWTWRSAVNERNRSRARLPDGSTVEILGTVYGIPFFTTETTWERWARKVLPKKLSDLISKPLKLSMFADSNTLSIIVELKGLPNDAGAAVPWTSFRAVDDTGSVCSGFAGKFTTKFRPSGRIVSAMMLNSFPRRQSEFWLELTDDDGAAMARIRVKNPQTGPFPIWTALPLPQTVTNGHTALTFKGLALESNRDGLHFSNPQFSVSSTISDLAGAAPIIENISDATGNNLETLSSPVVALSPNEPAWKIHAIITRYNLSRYVGDELLILSNIAIPQPGELVAINKKTNMLGVDVDVTWLYGASTSRGYNTTRVIGPPPVARPQGNQISEPPRGTLETLADDGSPRLMVNVRDKRLAAAVLVSTTDQDGQVLDSQRSLASFAGTAGFSFHPKPNSKTVTFRIVPTSPLSFDFVVNPQDLLSNSPGMSLRR